MKDMAIRGHEWKDDDVRARNHGLCHHFCLFFSALLSGWIRQTDILWVFTANCFFCRGLKCPVVMQNKSCVLLENKGIIVGLFFDAKFVQKS